MIIHDCNQQSENWFKVRAGRPTASQFSRIITPTGKDSSQWHDYATDLVAECIRPDEIGFYGTKDTDRGNELEPEARDLFAQRMEVGVDEVGFVTREDGIVGCSPDGLVYRPGKGEPIAGLEIKCPRAGKHARHFLAGELPDEHRVQVHGGMAVTGLGLVFHELLPRMLPLIVRVERDEFTEMVADALDRFLTFYAEHRRDIWPKLTGKEAAWKERPILISGPMVRAILDGTKSQTRRVVKTKPLEGDFSSYTGDALDALVRNHCPYGRPGDRRNRVRETFGAPLDDCKPSEIPVGNPLLYRADYGEDGQAGCKLWPSIFMPRWASRITLEITGIRVERLKDISEDDAEAEGISRERLEHTNVHPFRPSRGIGNWHSHASGAFRELWQSINGRESWEANPWVWVVEFKRIGGAA